MVDYRTGAICAVANVRKFGFGGTAWVQLSCLRVPGTIEKQHTRVLFSATAAGYPVFSPKRPELGGEDRDTGVFNIFDPSIGKRISDFLRGFSMIPDVYHLHCPLLTYKCCLRVSLSIKPEFPQYTHSIGWVRIQSSGIH